MQAIDRWRLLGVHNGFEYWTPDDGADERYADVFRRKVSPWNTFSSIDGQPLNVRWECKVSHYRRYIA